MFVVGIAPEEYAQIDEEYKSQLETIVSPGNFIFLLYSLTKINNVIGGLVDGLCASM